MRKVALNIRHREERDEIMQRLAKAVPDCFDDAMTLLKFATSRAESSTSIDGMDKSIIAMLKNAARGAFKAMKGRINLRGMTHDRALAHSRACPRGGHGSDGDRSKKAPDPVSGQIRGRSSLTWEETKSG
jgi:hypothetical protein